MIGEQFAKRLVLLLDKDISNKNELMEMKQKPRCGYLLNYSTKRMFKLFHYFVFSCYFKS